MKRWGVLALACLLAPGWAQTDTRRSGLSYMGPATQAMQRDDSQNPAMLWVAEGEALWRAPAGRDQKSCMSCHGDAAQSMRGVAARYPAFDAASKLPLNLSQRIQQCRQSQQQAAPWAAESQPLLSMETYVAHQSRGLSIAPPDDARLAPFTQRGQAVYARRIGQIDLSCAQCHDGQAGQRLAGNPIPQAHPTGYPVYRLEWQGMGSLQRRLRNCMTGVRAEAPPFGAAELVELELYLMQRAQGMALETPAVRP
ncbi:sulfur oxidation c-type cytochrome SoxA [Pseudorhodoferax sp. Leaf267]|uniref:sulfur oxidation c-type cytochrome SoxA n=1 Tax=Pseudorhodoferax sp. Leaf267 TaxID=1736316 RepID=UPI0006F84635|nr:sulfur oxidation c-type cytochrome SoxA [Pseudorhodoferax sp. Leaf267]KQP17706.1 sulfur oxidation c-type cytochrome SoxA [Pseudorhodoferax sp. Leaf267]